jgi:hypothetical protein
MSDITYSNIQEAVKANREKRFNQEVIRVQNSFQTFLNRLLKRVTEEHEVEPPTDEFVYTFSEAPLPETVDMLKSKGFNVEGTEVHGNPAIIQL